MQCLALDIGSSSIKGAVLNLETQSIEHVVRTPFPSPVKGLPVGFHEVDPAQIYQEAVSVVQQLLSLAPDATAVYSCGQMGGIMLLNAQHEPATNYLSWRDQRTVVPGPGGLTTLQTLRSCWSDEQFADLGSELKPGSATALLHWLSLQGRLPAGTIPVTVGDFVISRLCNAAPVMHGTQTIGMLNLRSRMWHREAFEAIGLPSLGWPEITDEVRSVGQTTIQGRTLVCYPVIGDQQAALRGIDLQPDELSINVSTGSQVSYRTSTFQPGQCQTRSWFGGEFLNTVTHIPAGRSLTVIEALLTELPRLAGVRIENSWKLIAQEAERASLDRAAVDCATTSLLRCNLSFFDSAMGSDGRIEGITTENFTVGSLFDAAFEFMADSYSVCARRLAETPPWTRLAVSGGLVQSFPTLRAKLERRFPLPTRELPEQEETLLGLMALARQGRG